MLGDAFAPFPGLLVFDYLFVSHLRIEVTALYDRNVVIGIGLGSIGRCRLDGNRRCDARLSDLRQPNADIAHRADHGNRLRVDNAFIVRRRHCLLPAIRSAMARPMVETTIVSRKPMSQPSFDRSVMLSRCR